MRRAGHRGAELAAGDGAHYAFGTFSTLGETPANPLARLLADGWVEDNAHYAPPEELVPELQGRLS